MGLTRRQLLQRAGLGVLTIGISEIRLEQIHHYAQVLAASSPRKLALLIGIDRYGDGSNSNLKGCITDVELQRELLIYRFGFLPTDILTLTGRQATREAIETAFIEHLIEQAQAGDVVIFHFSGYGNQVQLSPDGQWVRSFLPSDGVIAAKKAPAMNDLLEDTLFLLGRSLATDKLTMVLDTSHYTTGKPLQGNLRVRSFSIASEQPNLEELTFQSQLQQQFNKTITRKKPPFSGILLRAARKNQAAAEISGNGWSAGLFTYALTQYLWQVTPASQILIALRQANEQVERVMGQQQQPQLLTNGKFTQLSYYQMPESSFGGEGVVTKVEGETAEVYLTGLPAFVLDYYSINSRLRVVPSGSSSSETLLQISSRQGLIVKVQRISTPNLEQPLQVGQIVQEKIRVLPHDIGLVVALDSSLNRIERVDATSAFATMPVVDSIINAGEQRADCLLSLVGTDASESSYGLLSSGGVLILNTIGVANEAVKLAVRRLVPKLETLLAAKLWRLTLNEGSSGLKVSVKLEKLSQTPQLLQKATRPVTLATCGGVKPSNCPQGLSPTLLKETTITATEESDYLPKLPIGTAIQYRIENYEDKPLYCLLFGLDAIGNTIALCAAQPITEATAQSQKWFSYRIEPQKSLIIPSSTLTSNLKITAPVGLVEWLIICSVSPFEKTLAVLSPQNPSESLLTLSNPLAVARALWQDLSIAPSSNKPSNSPDYVFDVDTWTTFSFLYQVAE